VGNGATSTPGKIDTGGVMVVKKRGGIRDEEKGEIGDRYVVRRKKG